MYLLSLADKMLICYDDTDLYQDTYTGTISQWCTGTTNIFTTTFENEESVTDIRCVFVVAFFGNKYTYTLYR